MKRKFYIVILLALAPAFAHALGLGNLDLNSALNEPFDARIQLLSPTADELDSLKITLADSEAFARAKIDRPFILSKLKFALRSSPDDGPDYIRVFSQEPIREPFLNFLIEVSWSNGRLFREYTVLLDPPLYDPNARASEFTKSQPVVETTPEPVATIAKEASSDGDDKVIYWDDTEQTSTSAAPVTNYTGGDYGPTDSSDTLWSIASKMRPDTSVSVNQMMAALLRANPDAFVNQNINGLKRGQILRMPNESELTGLNNAEALAEAQSQHAAWADIKNNLSSAVTERPEVSSVPESTTTTEAVSTEAVVESEAELKLVAADDLDESTEQVSSADAGSGNELILAQESIQALTQENLELNDKLQESEALLADLKRLLSLKDDELAALQEQTAAELEVVEGAEESIAEAEDEAVEETEEEILGEATDEVVEETETVADDTEIKVVAEDEEEIAVIEDEVIDVIETEPEPGSDGIMGMAEQYLGKAKEFLLGNPMIGMAVGAVLVVLILIIVIMKFRKEPAETVQVDAMTEEAFPDFDSGELGDTGDAVPDSEAVTVLPDSEAETALHESEEPAADVDLDIEEEEKTQFIAEEEAPVEEEPEEDPLQEVNTYLAFEQFDQAEEFVRNVIETDPDNPEFHTKLLEVFYTSGNKKSYEEAAKVLHEKVGGEGEHWNMAVAMWQEMSPSRALFEEGGAEEEDDDDADNTGGFLNVTADDEAADDDSGGLDFDIGGADDTPVAESAADAGEEMLDVTASAEAEDMLDVTAAVGLDADASVADETAEDDMLDISGGSADSDGMLDITGSSTDSDEMLDITGSSTESDDLLDITSGEESASEDLLDVTAAADLDLDSEEDLLDVTAATSAGADSSELLGLEIEPESNELNIDDAIGNETVELDVSNAEAASEDVAASEDDNVLDFDIGSNDENSELEIEAGVPEADEPEDIGLEMDLGDAESGSEDAGLEMDLGIPEVESSESEDIGLEMDLGDSDSGDLGLDISLDTPEEDSPIRLDAEDDSASDSEEEISLDFDMGEDDGLELDLSAEAAEESPEFELELDTSEDASTQSDDDAGMDFDLSLDESSADDSSVDLDGTVEIPKSVNLDVDGVDDDDDDDEHTVFVPRAAQPEEQSAEDEIATKLDLAKAYVELGDKDSAKAILDEVMAEGNDEQRKQAQDLLG